MVEHDILSEGPISLSEAARFAAVNGKAPHPNAIWRWCRKGIRGVQLEYVRLGLRIVTSRPALSRFAVALAAADEPKLSAWKPKANITNPEALRQAAATLAAAGI
jgi:hypothetical protein